MAEEKKEKFNDLGLGDKASSGSYRSLNKDGTFNVKKLNVPFSEQLNFFHSFISMSWIKFLCVIIASYLGVNILFASIYTLIGVENLTIAPTQSGVDQFMEAFFFSAQTVTTLGYGRVAPIGYPANIVAAIESMVGLLSFALATGLLYGRFSKPSAKIKYSDLAVVAPYKDINGFMFRVINPQSNQLLEAEVTVTVSLQEENEARRSFHILELERSKVLFFPSTWTIVHPIDEDSPLYKLTEQDLLKKDAEFIIMIKVFDESFSQTVYSRSSYKADEIKWGEKFNYIIQREPEGIKIDVSRLNETKSMPLNS